MEALWPVVGKPRQHHSFNLHFKILNGKRHVHSFQSAIQIFYMEKNFWTAFDDLVVGRKAR